MSHIEPGHEESRQSNSVVSPVNEAAAEWLERLADQLASVEPTLTRRVTAYRLAARGLRESTHRAEELWKGGGCDALTRIDHVTPAIAQLIGELFATRRIPLPAPIR